MPLGKLANFENNKNIASDKLIRSTAGNVSNVRNKNIANKDCSTYATKKMTFYVKHDLLKKLYNFAYWDRLKLTEAFNLVLEAGLQGKKTEDFKREK